MDEYKDVIKLAEEAKHWELVLQLQGLDFQQRLRYLQGVLNKLAWHPKNSLSYKPFQLEEAVYLYAKLASCAASDLHLHPTILNKKNSEESRQAERDALNTKGYTAASALQHLPESNRSLDPHTRQDAHAVYVKAHMVFIKDIAGAWAGFEETNISDSQYMFDALIKELQSLHGDEALKAIREVNGLVPITRLRRALYTLKDATSSSPSYYASNLKSCFRDLTIAWVKRMDTDEALLQVNLAEVVDGPLSEAGGRILFNVAGEVGTLEKNARSLAQRIRNDFVVGEWEISSHDLQRKRVVLAYKADPHAVNMSFSGWDKTTKRWREMIRSFEHVVNSGVTVELNLTVQFPDGGSGVFNHIVKSKKTFAA